MALTFATGFKPTDLTEIPVIIVDGEVKVFMTEMLGWTAAALSELAFAMDGSVGWLKVRATFEPVETQHCTAKECWRPPAENSNECDSHG